MAQEVKESLIALDVDLTPSSYDAKAAVMRHLCELDGFIDYLLSADEHGVAACHTFVEEMASFLEEAKETHSKLQSNELILFEHCPLLAYWLIFTQDLKRRLFNLVWTPPVFSAYMFSGLPSARRGNLLLSALSVFTFTTVSRVALCCNRKEFWR